MSGRFLFRHAGAVGVVVFLSIWELAARLVWCDPAILPAPTQAIAQAFQALTLVELAGHAGVSLGRIVAGFALAAVAGIGLGVACGWFRRLDTIVRPFVELLRPIPPLAWIPLAIVWFGLGEPSKVFVIFLAAFFPIFTNAWRGVALAPPVIFRAARSMGVDGARLLWRVAIPAALPDIVVGLRVGFGLAFGILVAAELIAAEKGLGHLVMESRQVGHLGVAIFGILLIGILSMLADRALGALAQRAVGRWAKV